MGQTPAIPELRRPIDGGSHPPAEVTDLSGGILNVIERAARDPSVDIDKMERLIAMQERVLSRQAKEAYDAALAELQPSLPVVTEHGGIKDRNGNIQSTYALWEDINDAIRPLLAEHGFALSFKTGRQGDAVAVTGILSHRGGHREETTLELPADGSGSKNAVQAIGSSVQYGKRYTASALLNITSRGEDDDGQSATKYLPGGEPVARAKLDGPHPSKTALKNAINGIICEVRNATTPEQIDTILKRDKPSIKQAEKDWPALLNGDPKIPEDIGLKGTVAAQRAALADDGMVGTMLGSMKECQTLTSLYSWLDRNETAIAELDGADVRRFERERDAFESGLKAVAQVSAG